MPAAFRSSKSFLIASNMSQPDQPLSQCHIIDLNDDCFYHIYEFLPAIDWCSLRETCTRFRSISDYLFARQSKSFQLKPKNVYGSCSDFLSVYDAERLIRNFGQFITKLSVYGEYFEKVNDTGKLMPMLDRYCLRLTDLELNNALQPFDLDFGPATIIQCARLFSNLHRLVIIQWKDEETFSCCLAHCSSLKELELIDLREIKGKFLANRFESLESVTMTNCWNMNTNLVGEFFAKNWQLKRVKIWDSCFNGIYPIVEDVAISFPNLETLSLRYNRDFLPRVVPVTRIPLTLKKLEIDLELVRDDIINQILTSLTVSTNIEDLYLVAATLTDESMSHLCKLKTLKILRLASPRQLDGNKCRKLARELSSLSEIQIIECYNVAFNEMKEFVVHSNSLNRIVFYRRFEPHRPSFTKASYMSLVKARQNKQTNETLCVFLSNKDRIYLQYKSEMSKLVTAQAHVIKLLPLEDDQKRTVSEYDFNFYRSRFFGSFIDDDSSDDDFSEVEFSD